MEIYTVAFFGHRYIERFFSVEPMLEKHIRTLIDEFDNLLCGSQKRRRISDNTIRRKEWEKVNKSCCYFQISSRGSG